jgi:hypothetical protein
LALAASALLALAGCSVARFIAGAPATRDAAPQSMLLERRCSGCHDAPDPAVMTATAWRASLDRMRRRMTLPESEWDSLAAMRRDDARR